MEEVVRGRSSAEVESGLDKKINSHISRIGAHASGGDCFDGAIDQVVMFEVALSEKEIQSLHDGTWLAVDSADKVTVTWSNLKQK